LQFEAAKGISFVSGESEQEHLPEEDLLRYRNPPPLGHKSPDFDCQGFLDLQL
jgi:hypothetical protein